MTMLSMRTHPNEATLSRLADQSEIERARSRAGRHVARCEECAKAIAAMHALGEAARAMPDEALPTTLYGRIEAARRAGEAPNVTAGQANRGEPANRGTTAAPTSRRRPVALAIAAAMLLAVLIAPIWRRRVLAAASSGEATIFPRYPRPGATVGIRFVPSTHWTGPDTLWASGRVDLRVAPNDVRRLGYIDVGGPIVRDRDGAYRGRLQLPDDALAGSLTIWTEARRVIANRPVIRLVLLTGDSSGNRPSLDAMEDAVLNERGFMTGRTLSDAFARWAPQHPLRWVVSTGPGSGEAFNWLQFFTSNERTYARLATQLDARTRVRAGELAGMAKLAYQIEEPTAAGEWTDRLVHEYPASAYAFSLRVQQLHAMELREAPRDSIAARLPSLDSLYALSGGRIGEIYTLRTVVGNNADSATARRWALREARAGSFFPTVLMRGRMVFGDAELRDSVEAFARDVLANQFLREHAPPESWYTELSRPRAYASLAAIELERGRYSHAIALTDSARAGDCVWPGQDTRALALLALGDTVAAVPFLAVYARYPLSADSAKLLLGSHFNETRWRQASDSVEAARRACFGGR